MNIYLEKAAKGSLDDIQSDLENYLGKHFSVVRDLYRGADVSVTNFLKANHNNDYFFKKNKKNVLIQPMDGTTVKEEFMRVINRFDLVITPSSVGKRLLAESGCTRPTVVVP